MLDLMKYFYLINLMLFVSSHTNLAAQTQQDYQVLHQLGRDAMKEARYEEALSFFNQTIKAMPYYSQVWFERGQAKFNLDDYEGAIQDFGVALKKNPYKANWYVQRGLAFSVMHQDDRAKADFEEALKINPQHTLAAQYLQNMHQKKDTEIPQITDETDTEDRYRRLAQRQRKSQIIWGVVAPLGMLILFNRWLR